MSTLPYVCCCETDGYYYADKCANLTSTECCFPSCPENAPERIILCPTYLVQLGLVLPLDLQNNCYVLAYGCCAYIIRELIVAPCPPPNPQYPVNVGRLWFINTGTPPDDCCINFPFGRPPKPVGTMGLVNVGTCGPAIRPPQWPEEFCIEVIADCYDLCDQLGTVKSKPLVFQSSMTLVQNKLGIDPPTRCDDTRIDTYVAVNRQIEAAFSLCNKEYFEVSNQQRYAPAPQPTPCNYFQFQFEADYLSCATGGCWPVWRADCCLDYDTCAANPQACDNVFDPLWTYQVRSCYDARDTNILYSPNPVHEESMLDIVVDYCYLQSQEVDWNDQSQLDTWLASFIQIGTGQWNSCWKSTDGTGPALIQTLLVQVCNLDVHFVSGTIDKLAERLNYQLGYFLRAEISPMAGKWKNYFWFGRRQPCEPCDCHVPDNERIPYSSDGDLLLVNGVVNDPAAGGVRISLVAQSPRKYAGVYMEEQNNEGDLSCPLNTNCGTAALPPSVAAISGKGSYPYELHVLSVPEYSSGERYEWVRVEELSGNMDICTAPNQLTSVVKCESRQGWPLDDVIVTPPVGPPYVAQYGWHTLGVNIGIEDPQSRTRCYPFDYTPAPCCPQGYPDCNEWYALYPEPIPCVLDCFQLSFVYFSTDASTPVLAECGTPDPYPVVGCP